MVQDCSKKIPGRPKPSLELEVPTGPAAVQATAPGYISKLQSNHRPGRRTASLQLKMIPITASQGPACQNLANATGSIRPGWDQEPAKAFRRRQALKSCLRLKPDGEVSTNLHLPGQASARRL